MELLHLDFDDCPDGPLGDDWWVEGGEKVWIDGGKLRIKADPPGVTKAGIVCTVWNRTPLPADVTVRFDAHVVDSSCDANNVNFFLHYADPSGTPLFDTRETRTDGDYSRYHVLSGYIFTFLNDAQGESGRHGDGTAKARMRMRRCPGFNLVDQTFDYRCRKGETYRVKISKRGGEIVFGVDGVDYLRWTDPQPLTGGLFALRTYRTDLWFNHIRVND